MVIISQTGENGMMSDINVTPLVDVMLVLLTVFIVTAPLLLNAVSVTLPKTSPTAAVSEFGSVRISITDDGTVYLDQRQVANTAVEQELRRLRAHAQRELSVEILADERVPYGSVARVMAQIQRAGIVKFAFVMLPETARVPPQ